MKDLRLGKFLVVIIALTLILPLTALAAPVEPIPDTTFRSLRTGYVKTWHIFNDSKLDGILNPGDTRIETFRNWWTPASSHSQHNYSQGPYEGNYNYPSGHDKTSGPINYASHNGSGLDDYWLQRDEDGINFYMTYSQFDNNNWKGGYNATYLPAGDPQTIVKDRHENRNGWALGWVTHQKPWPINSGNNTQNLAGKVEMDIFIHHGRGLDDTGLVNVDEWNGQDHLNPKNSYSNPEISMSNDIGLHPSFTIDARDFASSNGQFHPAQWDENNMEYNMDANLERIRANFPHLDAAGRQDYLDKLVLSMEVREYDPALLDNSNVLVRDKHPEWIRNNLTEHDGTSYVYKDAFKERSEYHDGATDGGVIAGLAGQEEYVPDLNGGTWGDQQVIRIDISEETLATVSQITFWDFGDSDGTAYGSDTSPQVQPRAIIFGVDLNRLPEEGQIYYDDPVNGRIYFPDNRIYIAQVQIEYIPEPASLTLLVLGAGLMLLRRRRAAM